MGKYISHERNEGFTLIELLITMMIAGLLLAVAYPAYTTYIVHARRAEAQTGLLDLSNRLERYYTENNTYVGATLANIGADVTTPNGAYTLSINAQTATSFTVLATAAGPQANDDAECANFTLNNLNQKTVSGSGNVAECWS